MKWEKAFIKFVRAFEFYQGIVIDVNKKDIRLYNISIKEEIAYLRRKKTMLSIDIKRP